MAPYSILVGDCREQMATLAPNSIDAIVTDPPYHLTTDKKGGSGPASVNLDSPYGRARIGTGFMGKAWDGGDVAFRPETWAGVLRVARPGALLLAFGGTRTFHRMMVAIEDGGWELRDTIMWVYGSGFPKSLNLEGERSGWGTALKPAWEPIVLARKSLVGTVEANVTEHGTGALNINGCRIASEGGKQREGEASQSRRYAQSGATNFAATPGPRGGCPDGRWPANLIHDGSDEVVSRFPQTESGKQGENGHTRNSDKHRGVYAAFPGQRVEGDVLYGDSGSAARFFYCAKADRADRNVGLEGAAAVRFGMSGAAAAAAARGEDYDNGDSGMNRTTLRKNHHPTVKPTDLMRYLCRLVTPPGGLVLDPFMGSGSTGRGARLEGFRFVGIEQDAEYCEIARRRIAEVAPLFGAHACAK